MSDLSKYTDAELFDLYGSNIGDELRNRGYEYGWYKRTVYVGEIYILVNKAFPDLVKIGYSQDAEQRAKQLSSSTAVPSPYHVYATYKVKKSLADKRLHTLIDTLNPDLHYSTNREFFVLAPDDAYRILKAIAEIVGDEEQLVLNPCGDEYVHSLLGVFSDLDKPSDESEEDNIEPKLKRQPPFSFEEFGIPVGAQLLFFDRRFDCVRDDIGAQVLDAKHILYKGQKTSLSAVARDILGLKNSPRGTEWWVYDDELLVDIYQKKYPKPKKVKK